MKSVFNDILKLSTRRTIMGFITLLKGWLLMLFLVLCIIFIGFVVKDLWQKFSSSGKEGQCYINHKLGLCGVLLLGVGFWIT